MNGHVLHGFIVAAIGCGFNDRVRAALRIPRGEAGFVEDRMLNRWYGGAGIFAIARYGSRIGTRYFGRAPLQAVELRPDWK